MNKTSSKQRAKNEALKKIKQELPDYCVICGSKGTDLAHLLPRSLWPEHITNPENVTILCRNCHQQFDDNVNFRQHQTKLYKQACKVDERAANRYFRK